MDVGHDILAVDEIALPAFGPQRDMQDGAALADIDLLAGEHRVPARRDPSRAGEIEQQTYGLVGDPVLGIVKEEARGLQAEALAAFRIARELGPQMQALHAFVVRLERFPLLRSR